MATHDFYSKENMVLIIDIFSNYMNEKQGINLENIDDSKHIKKYVYSTMNEVYDRNIESGKSTQELNVIVLTHLRDYYLKKSKGMTKMNRDVQVFGDRKVALNELIPENSKLEYEQEISLHSLDRLINDRERQVNPHQPKPDISKLGKQIREVPENSDSFAKRLQMLQQERNIPEAVTANDNLMMERLTVDNETVANNNILQHDPTSIFRKPISSELLGTSETSSTSGVGEGSMKGGDIFLNPRGKKVKELHKYVSINSADRNWALEPIRYKYSVNSLGDNSDLQNRYKNIESISVGKVVIPEEIIERVTNVTSAQNMKTFFNYDFSFAYPYLILSIDEFNNVYDGTNEIVRKAFSKLIYHRSYKAPNGRGYIILKPMQKEKKYFYPTPLSSFGKLNISLLKPSGDLLNDSSDSYKLFKVEYEAFNTQYLKIVTDIYFDKNEFFVGDEVIIQDHYMTVVTDGMSDINVRRFNDFINRKEGHEIKQIGGANDNGYYRTFYIQAPGYFDKREGRFVVDDVLINTLNTYNTEFNFCDPEMPTNGRILNNSLQHTISLQVEILVDDARIIDKYIL